ncbi:hypothetical protein KCU60_g24487, partial [Aureobasidium melanogenum]
MQSSSTTTSTLSQPNAAKRPFSDTGLDDADTDHDSFPWSLSGQEEAELLAAPETPRKAVKFDVSFHDCCESNALQALSSAATSHVVKVGCRTTQCLDTAGHPESLTLPRPIRRYIVVPIHPESRRLRRSERLKRYTTS